MIKKGLKINCVVVVVHLCDFTKILNSYILKKCIIKCMVVNCILINGYKMHVLRKKSSFNSWHLRSSWAHHDKVFKLIPRDAIVGQGFFIHFVCRYTCHLVDSTFPWGTLQYLKTVARRMEASGGCEFHLFSSMLFSVILSHV